MSGTTRQEQIENEMYAQFHHQENRRNCQKVWYDGQVFESVNEAAHHYKRFAQGAQITTFLNRGYDPDYKAITRVYDNETDEQLKQRLHQIHGKLLLKIQSEIIKLRKTMEAINERDQAL